MPERSTSTWGSLPDMMLGIAAARPERVMLRHWEQQAWQATTWRRFAERVAGLAAGLRAAGVAPGDRVLLVSENRPEFLISDVAIMAIGAITVPTYVTNTVADHAHILGDCGARAAIVSTAALAERVAAAAALSGGLDLIVGMEGAPPAPTGARALSYAELEAGPGDLPLLMAEAAQIPAGRLA
ncbi:MAG: AMP-binding protein, partial [Rubritepida sp.]|nr:AMP-binding protein [Rubritepida sp.]